MHSDRYEEAKRLVEEHEQACLDEFKQKLKALCDEYAITARVRLRTHGLRTGSMMSGPVRQ
jgi:hypothetical protein